MDDQSTQENDHEQNCGGGTAYAKDNYNAQSKIIHNGRDQQLVVSIPINHNVKGKLKIPNHVYGWDV